jgi:hypothetical protein
MNVLRLKYRMVSSEGSTGKQTNLIPLVASEAIEIFTALLSSDAYRTMTSHLGPDPMVNI